MKFKQYMTEQKPKKGDFVERSHGGKEEIDTVSRGTVYLKGTPVAGSKPSIFGGQILDREPVPIKYLELKGKYKNKNLWLDIF